MSNETEEGKALVVLSGGQDSTTCLFWALEAFGVENVAALTFDYGQRHSLELEAARHVAKLARVVHSTVRVGPILSGLSPLTNEQEPLEQYADWKSLPGGLEKTFVPGRNMLFMVLAANRCYVQKRRYMVLGLSQEDFGGYPDCRGTFVNKMQDAIRHGLDYGIEVATPLLMKTKAQTVVEALRYPGCYHALAYSHTAYDGAYPPTGRDHATLLRAKGFEEAGVPDPLIVRAFRENLISVLPEGENYRHWEEYIGDLTGRTIDEELQALEMEVRASVKR